MIRVLIIDDYDEHVQTLVATLNMYGCEARGAASGSEALEIVGSWHPHLIICDGLLEGMRAWRIGFEILSGEDKLEEENRPYMVALTGFGSLLQRCLCEECGYDEYVTKPIELSTLLMWVQKARQRAEAKKH